MQIKSIGMPISYNRNKTTFGYRPSLAYETEIYLNTKPEFKNAVINAIKKFPQKYQQLIQDNNYRIIIAPSLEEVLYMNAAKPFKDNAILNNYSDDISGRIIKFNKNNYNSIVFTPNTKNTQYAENIVNHTLGKAISQILRLGDNMHFYETFKKDIIQINKERKIKALTPAEIKLFAQKLALPNAQIKTEEVIPDLIAWCISEGKYGCGLYEVYNPFLLTDLFPQSSSWLCHNL